MPLLENVPADLTLLAISVTNVLQASLDSQIAKVAKDLHPYCTKN